MRIKFKEITLNRIFEAVIRRLENFPHLRAWKKANGNKNFWKLYHNIHKGERCFLIANGPSLKSTDLTLLSNEITIGMNRIYLLFDEEFSTTYFTTVNELVLEQFSSDIQGLNCDKFVNWKQRDLFGVSDDLGYFLVSQAIKDGFSLDMTKGVFSGGTITYVSLQLAYYMGFKEVILIGLDHNFEDKGTPNKTEIRNGDDKNHFHPDYFPKGMKWQLPDLYRSELAYAKAREIFEKDGRKILDATIGGKCDVFEKVEYESLFRSIN